MVYAINKYRALWDPTHCSICPYKFIMANDLVCDSVKNKLAKDNLKIKVPCAGVKRMSKVVMERPERRSTCVYGSISKQEVCYFWGNPFIHSLV